MDATTELRDAAEAALEALDELARAAHRADWPGRERFRAYHMAEIEGAGGDWAGGPYLVDALRELLGELAEASDDGCPECGRDIDRLGGNPDCEVCAAEPTLADRLVRDAYIPGSGR